jgi:hypothetical protein
MYRPFKSIELWHIMRCDDIKQCAVPTGGSATCSNGECSQICPEGMIAQNGQCVSCPSNMPNVCSNTCTNLDKDVKNCGTCGNECGLNQVCNKQPGEPMATCKARPPCYYDSVGDRRGSCGGSDCCFMDGYNTGIHVCALDTGQPTMRFCFCTEFGGMGGCSTFPPS